MATLITNFEIISKSVVKREYPLDNLAMFKDIVESHYLRNCFGKDFYAALKADVNDWSTVTEWEAGTYALNDLVSWNGLILRSTQAANTQEPSLTASQWVAASKFDESEYTTLWNTYLCQIIANKILMACVVPDSYRATAKGLMKSTEDSSNTEPLDKSDIGLWYTHVNNFIDMAESEMKAYMQAQYDLFTDDPLTGFDYSDINFISCEDCPTMGNKVTRRIGFDD